MKLNLKLFEQQVDPVILQRGLKYFKSGAVEEIERTGSDADFVVIGSEPYDVHREEFVRLYCDAIRRYVEGNMGRDSYIALTRYIRRIKKFGEGPTALALAEELK